MNKVTVSIRMNDDYTKRVLEDEDDAYTDPWLYALAVSQAITSAVPYREWLSTVLSALIYDVHEHLCANEGREVLYGPLVVAAREFLKVEDERSQVRYDEENGDGDPGDM